MTAERPGAGPSLVHRAAELLEEGPLHTLEVARRVLGLEGHPGAASAAVFSLLGQDRRFRVDGEGTWQQPPTPPGRLDMDFRDWMRALEEELARTTGAREVGEETLNRFYILHCIAIPLAVALLLAIHFWRVRKDGGISGPM